MIRTFTITQQHLDLLSHACLMWNDMEFGAPGIDPKRPYGNSSVYSDIAEILAIKPEGRDGDFTPDQEDQMYQLHRGTLIALQIAIDIGCLYPGTYGRIEVNGMLRWAKSLKEGL